MSAGNQDRSRAIAERDAALARISRARGWAIAGTAAVTAGVAGFVSAVAPGRTLGAKRTAPVAPVRVRPTSTTSLGAPKMPPLADPHSLGLAGPAQPPAAPSQDPQSDPSQAPSGSAPAQSAAAPAQSAPAPAPAQSAPAPAPAPAQAQAAPASSDGGAVVSGGS